MSSRVDFTLEEWWLLQELPLMVSTTVLYASSSGAGGTMQEILAGATSLANASHTFPNNELIQALMEPTEDSRIFKRPPGLTSNTNKKEREEQLKKQTLAQCQRAADILFNKVESHEAREYKMWVMAVGGDVAAAVKEGGVLGLGAKRITEEEAHMLEEIAKALRFSAITPTSL
jgi:hypothetical protein